MKRNLLSYNKKSRMASIALSPLNNMNSTDQIEKLIKISKLFEGRTVFTMLIKPRNSTAFFGTERMEVKTVIRGNGYDIIAIKCNSEELSNLISAAVLNDDRTEIYYVNEISWERFINNECRLLNGEYSTVLVINDNNETYINFNQDKYDINNIQTSISRIFKN